MKKVLKNKKGFTLIELLAVIVILALIMSIAVVAMSGVINSSQDNSARRTAANLISGVRQRLMLNGNLKTGTYYFTDGILERGGKTSPLGGDFIYITGNEKDQNGTADKYEKVSGTDGIYIVKGAAVGPTASTTAPSCSPAGPSFIHANIPADGSAAVYTICLVSGDGNRYVEGTETEILADSDDVIKTPTANN